MVGVKLALLVVVKMLLEMCVKMEGATRSRPSSGRRRLEGPASPLWSLGASQIQELEIVGGGEGVGEEDHQVEHLWLPQPRRLGGQLPAGCGGLSLLGHGCGGVDQELVARVEQVKVKKMVSRTQAAA